MKNDFPETCNVRIYNASFDEKLTEVLDNIDQQQERLAPAFVMLDPFGFSDTPMRVIQRILTNPKTEIYISLMYNDINRFMGKPHLEPTLDELFGCQQWREGRNILDPEQRTVFLLDLYEECLREAGAKYVLHFELYRENRLVYAVFFATQDRKGCDEMKKAIWKAIPIGDFKFRGGRAHHLTLGEEAVDLTPLREELHEEFGQKEWVAIDDVIDFVMSDNTGFHTGHLKRKTLAPMEREGEIEVKTSNPKRRRGSFLSGAMLKFNGI